MIKIAEGSVFGHELLFASGAPSGAISYTVRGNDNLPITALTNLSVTPASGAVSHQLVIPPSGAVLATGATFEGRTLSWSYDAVSGSVRYRVDAYLPFAVSIEGVRAKLGLFDDELSEADIDLTAAYVRFAGPIVAQEALAASALAGDFTTLAVTDAIEAVAALAVLPGLQLKLAKSRSSGTNKFERQSDPDWAMLREYLTGLVSLGTDAIDVPSDIYGGTGFLLAFSTRTDPITG